MRYSSLIILIVVLALPIVALIATRNSSNTSETMSTLTPSATPVERAADLTDPADAVTASKVVLVTSKGDITINLYQDAAPKTVQNFVTLGKRGYYNGVIFHRVIESFMIQTGDPTGTGRGGESIYGDRFPDEINDRKIEKGTVAMANTGIKNTNSSQFFIVTKEPQPHLDGLHTAFGQIDPASQPVVDAIAASPVNEEDRPLEEVKITEFRIVE